MRSESPATYGAILACALFGLVGAVVWSVPLSFAPGWANGWPGGLSILRVWSAGMTIILFSVLIMSTIGAGALISLILCIIPRSRPHAWCVFRIWVASCSVLSVAIAAWGYQQIYASALEMWPHGYPS